MHARRWGQITTNLPTFWRTRQQLTCFTVAGADSSPDLKRSLKGTCQKEESKCSRAEDARRCAASQIHRCGWRLSSSRRSSFLYSEESCCFWVFLSHRELTPAFNRNQRRRVRKAGFSRVSGGGITARAAHVHPSVRHVEAKFKSHNKIVCDREAINGGWFKTGCREGHRNSRGKNRKKHKPHVVSSL